jgi:hypothetical protein
MRHRSEGAQTPLWRAPTGIERRVVLVQYVSRPMVGGKQARNAEDDAQECEDARQSGWMHGRS